MEILRLIALLGSIVLAVATVMSVLLAVWSYRRSAHTQVQLLALNSLQHYLDMAASRPDLASRAGRQPVDAQYAWFAAQALVTAQTLWTVVGDQTDWQRSINAIVRQHRSYLRSGAFVCEDFSPAFVGYLRERCSDVRCADPDAEDAGVAREDVSASAWEASGGIRTPTR